MTTTSKDARTRGAEYEAPVPVPKAKRTRGRPSDYEPALIDEACRLIRQGLTDSEVCVELGISVPAYYRWRANFPEFREATNAAKEVQDDRVVDSLIRTAHEGNVTAQIFWLKNRRPAEWRDRKETELIVPMDGEASEAPDQRALGLQVLAFLSGAAYDPDLENAADTPLLDLTANQREENEDGTSFYRQQSDDVLDDPDFDEPARGRNSDFDPGEL